MISRKLPIINELGLHARAATKLASLAGRYESTIKTGIEPPLVDAKSIMSLLLLAASQGTELSLRVQGEGAQQAHTDVCNIINNRFDEDE